MALFGRGTARGPDPATGRRRIPWLALVRPGISVAIVAAAIVAIHALSREVTLHALLSAFEAAPGRDVAFAILLTAVSFAALSLYDVIAVRVAAAGRVPAWLAALAGAAGYAVSNTLGFGLLTGGALRARIYGARGLEVAAIGGIFATAWLAFALGVSLATGLVLIFGRAALAAGLGLPPGIDRLAGVLILAAFAGVLVWLGPGRRRLRLRGRELRLPGLRLALAQTAVALVDVTAAALALWVLLPADAAPGPGAFFVAYVVAMVVGILSHSPGGLGAFEATLIADLGLGGRPDVLAALILYRLIYYLLPFTLAALAVVLVWFRGQRQRARRGPALLLEAVAPLVPPVAGGLALVSGAVLVFSGALPAVAPRTAALQTVTPLVVAETSHLVGSAVGVVLIVLARGLLARQARAWGLAVAMLGLGIAASLLKGIDWEEALLLAVALALMLAVRRAFYRQDEGPLTLGLGAAVGAAMILGASVWLGVLSYRHVDYGAELWWRFAWDGDAPRFLRASVVAAVLLAGLGAATLLARRHRAAPAEPVPETVRRLVAESPETEANIALLGDKRFLVAPDDSAFLMYRQTPVALVAKSDPFGAAEAAEALAWEFRERADRAGLIPVFYAVGTRYLPVYLDMGLSILKIGEVARVDLTSFTLDGPRRKELRYARGRAAREGLGFGILPAEAVPGEIAALRAVSDAWLAGKAGQEKSFALGGFDPAYLVNFPHAVMRDRDGRIRAFANLWLGAGREELSCDLMRYDPAAPNVTMDALFAELLLWGRAEGYRWFNLGAAPFAGMARHRLATRWNRIGALVYEHGETLYHFEGLRAFKEKFDPVWSPNYLACPGGIAAIRALIEVNRLISGGARGLFG